MSALSTYTGPRSAQERAIVHWNLDTIVSDQEQASYRRMMTALRRLEAPTTTRKSRTSRYQQGDTDFWRKAREANLRRENARLERQRQMRKRYAR